MKAAAMCLAGLAFAVPLLAAPVTVTITGVTGEIKVGEGPIFGHSSYQTIPPGAPFVLTYTFDEAKGKQTIAATKGLVITESTIENTNAVSPGANAVLQIGTGVWEFGPSTRSQVTLKTGDRGRSEQFTFVQAGSNRVAAEIAPGKGGYWPTNGDWRASFLSTSLEGSTATFSADNDRVSAKGKLIPETITVAGVDLDGQWLRQSTAAEGKRQWKLAHASPKGGYIVEEVRRVIRGSRPDGAAITPSSVTYWQAWKILPGADAPADAVDDFPAPGPPGSTGEQDVTATARFYEGLSLPSSFIAGGIPFAGDRFSSEVDPKLLADSATLPVMESFTLRF